VFCAALQQFDELLMASERSGPASAPLPLFYALSQAGRAIAAARCDDERWDFAGHGIKATDAGTLGSTTIQPSHRRKGSAGTDAFSVVSDATGSPPIRDAVELGRVWASVPGRFERATGLGEEHFEALLLVPVGPGRPAYMAEISVAEAMLPEEADREVALERRLAEYPDARGVWAFAGHRITTPPGGSATAAFSIWFHASGQTPGLQRPLSSVGHAMFGEDERYLRPQLNDAGDLPTPLMSTWLILYGLAHLARYRPAAWTGALNRDASSLAVPIERGLSWMRETLPRQIVHAITDQWPGT
jgi:hypothetical protein